MATSLEESEKLDLMKKIHPNTFHLVKKIVKIGPVDTEIALLIVKKEKKKKLRKVKYIAQSAGLPSGLNKLKRNFLWHEIRIFVFQSCVFS